MNMFRPFSVEMIHLGRLLCELAPSFSRFHNKTAKCYSVESDRTWWKGQNISICAVNSAHRLRWILTGWLWIVKLTREFPYFLSISGRSFGGGQGAPRTTQVEEFRRLQRPVPSSSCVASCCSRLFSAPCGSYQQADCNGQKPPLHPFQ